MFPQDDNPLTAPRRRWVITLSGHVDIGLGDGTAMSFYPGDLFLADLRSWREARLSEIGILPAISSTTIATERSPTSAKVR